MVDLAIQESLAALLQMTPDELAEDRYKRFRAIGAYVDPFHRGARLSAGGCR